MFLREMIGDFGSDYLQVVFLRSMHELRQIRITNIYIILI